MFRLFALGALSVSISASAELRVLYENGPTRPTSPFVGRIQAEVAQQDLSWNEAKNFGFPVTSNLWKVGEFKAKGSGLARLPLPMFIVGCDDQSLTWMQNNREQLSQSKSLGLVVSCESRNDLERLRGLVTPLILQPLNGDDLGRKLGHYTYPALITKDRIMQ